MLEALAAGKKDVKVRKFNINRPGVQGIDYESPLAKEHVRNGIPAFEVYDPEGKPVANAFNQLVEWCNQAGMSDDYLRQAGCIR